MAAAVVVDDRAEGHVERGGGLVQRFGPIGLTESDGPQREAILPQLERQVPLRAADFFGRLGQLDSTGKQHRSRVTGAERGHELDLLHGAERKLAERGFAVDAELGTMAGRVDGRGGVFEKRGAEGVDVRFVDPQARGGGVPTVRDEILAARGQAWQACSPPALRIEPVAGLAPS